MSTRRFDVMASPRQWRCRPVGHADPCLYSGLAPLCRVNLPRRVMRDPARARALLVAARDDLIARTTWS